MLVGVPKEIKDSEYRVGLVPSTVRELARSGHQVLVETNAGVGAGLTDADYRAVGAEIAANADEVFARGELIMKVKEPLAAERKKLRPGQVLFTYLHLAADPQQTTELMASGVIAIAYETVTSAQGTLPLLMPMSEVAGRMAPHVGARCLEKENGGRGGLPGGVPGLPPAGGVILGGRQPRRADQRGDGRDRDRRRPKPGCAAPRRQPARRAGAHRVLDQRRDRDAVPSRRPGDRVGADSGRGGAEADHQGHRQGDEGRLRHRRYRHRSGRLLRDLAADDAFGADLHRG